MFDFSQADKSRIPSWGIIECHITNTLITVTLPRLFSGVNIPLQKQKQRDRSFRSTLQPMKGSSLRMSEQEKGIKEKQLNRSWVKEVYSVKCGISRGLKFYVSRREIKKWGRMSRSFQVYLCLKESFQREVKGSVRRGDLSNFVFAVSDRICLKQKGNAVVKILTIGIL